MDSRNLNKGLARGELGQSASATEAIYGKRASDKVPKFLRPDPAEHNPPPAPYETYDPTQAELHSGAVTSLSVHLSTLEVLLHKKLDAYAMPDRSVAEDYSSCSAEEKSPYFQKLDTVTRECFMTVDRIRSFLADLTL